MTSRRSAFPYHLDAVKQLAALVALEQTEDRFLDHRERTRRPMTRTRRGGARRTLDDVDRLPVGRQLPAAADRGR
jgi:hypothetical protein